MSSHWLTNENLSQLEHFRASRQLNFISVWSATMFEQKIKVNSNPKFRNTKNIKLMKKFHKHEEKILFNFVIFSEDDLVFKCHTPSLVGEPIAVHFS